MHHRQRPSKNELHKRLKEAEAALLAGRRFIADARFDRRKTEVALESFGLSDLEFWQLLYECVQIALENPEGTYRPPFPAKSTKTKEAKSLYMWAFEVYHDERDLDIYFKYCLKPDPSGIYYLHISCHESE
jgi:hypothetical protein